MPVDIDAAEQFMFANARLLDRHRLAALLHGAPVEPALVALRAYGNAAAASDTRWNPMSVVPFVLPTAARYPHGPWMVPSDGGSHLTFALTGALHELGAADPWLARATDWCWTKLARPAELSAYWVKFALDFLEQDDGGWMFDWLGWSPGQIVEWRGGVTLRALSQLLAHGRLVQ